MARALQNAPSQQHSKERTCLQTGQHPEIPCDGSRFVGTGVIGASGPAYDLSRGSTFVRTDPAPNAESNLRSTSTTLVELAKAGLVTAGAPRSADLHGEHERALAEADFARRTPRATGVQVKLFAR